jgi:hypothetical protein
MRRHFHLDTLNSTPCSGRHIQEIEPNVRSQILQFAFWMQNSGYTNYTQSSRLTAFTMVWKDAARVYVIVIVLAAFSAIVEVMAPFREFLAITLAYCWPCAGRRGSIPLEHNVLSHDG